MIEKIVEINDTYFIKILYHEDSDRRLYSLVGFSNGEYITLCQSFNRDAFLLKTREFIEINNKIELLVASY